MLGQLNPQKLHRKINILYMICMSSSYFQILPIAMDAFSLLLCGVVLLLGTLFLRSRNSKRAQFIRMIDQIPGPQSYPIIGTMLPFMLVKRNGKLQDTLAYLSMGNLVYGLSLHHFRGIHNSSQCMLSSLSPFICLYT
jgi:hypothetical protein